MVVVVVVVTVVGMDVAIVRSVIQSRGSRIFTVVVFSTSVDFSKSIPIPSATQLINKSFVVQGVMFDPSNGTLHTTNAKLVTLGF